MADQLPIALELAQDIVSQIILQNPTAIRRKITVRENEKGIAGISIKYLSWMKEAPRFLQINYWLSLREKNILVQKGGVGVNALESDGCNSKIYDHITAHLKSLGAEEVTHPLKCYVPLAADLRAKIRN